MKIKEYIIINAIDAEEFLAAVNIQIKLGYEPVGNIIFDKFCQVMVKYED